MIVPLRLFHKKELQNCDVYECAVFLLGFFKMYFDSLFIRSVVKLGTPKKRIKIKPAEQKESQG